MGGIQSCFSPAPYVELKANNVDETILTYYTNLTSAQLGSTVAESSDQFFGNAKHLLRDTSPVKDHQAKDGAHDGWQPRRHLASASVIVRLGSHGHIYGVDINTIGFDDAAPNTATVEASRADPKKPGSRAHQWDTLLSEVPLKANSHNFFLLGTSDHVYSRVKLTVNPGGGVARFRCYGDAVPSWGKQASSVNLASAKDGARIIRWTDIKHSNNPNILLDHSKSAEDGWETPHSRKMPRNDYVVVQLASPGSLSHLVVSTEHFVGNAPEAISIDGCRSREEDPAYDYSANWEELVQHAPVKANSKNKFDVATNQVFSHLRLTVHPDGGIQQFSAMGQPIEEEEEHEQEEHDKHGDKETPAGASKSKESTRAAAAPKAPRKRRSKSPRAAAEKAAETIHQVSGVRVSRRKKRRTTAASSSQQE